MRCNENGVNGYCLYTSQDTGITVPDPTLRAVNPYSMRDTLGFFSPSGRPGTWQPRGVLFTESQIPWVPSGANHEWAPGAFQEPDGRTFLFVPDVEDPEPTDTDGDGLTLHNSSKIAVGFAFSPFGPFGYLTRISATDQSGNPWNGYMSDPEPFEDSNGNRYMLWANGSFQTCGGLSGGRTDTWNTVTQARDLTITGWPTDWGTCVRTSQFGGQEVSSPYLEGPSIFRFSAEASDLSGLPGTYTLVVPAKPRNGRVPAECVVANRGEPGTDLSVLTWATSSNPLGPYTYRGILMCGSYTEWTNQATIAEMSTTGGNKRMALIYHDGPGGTNPVSRQTHADCLFYGNGKFVVTKRFAEGFTDCMSDLSPYTNGLTPKASGSADTRRVVSARNNGGSPVTATQFEVSEWERFAFVDLGNNVVAVKYAVNGGRYLSAATAGGTPGTSPMIADRSAIGPWERFLKQTNGDGSISLKSTFNNMFVQVGNNGQLFANLGSITTADAGRFFTLHQ
jgi:hypothetical protein